MRSNHIIAARGLLRWSQGDLAEACGVSIRSITQIESEKQNPSQDTLTSIEMAFDRAGVVFKDNGVLLLDRSITVIEGNNHLIRLFEDIEFSTACKGELLIDGADESLTPPELVQKVSDLRQRGLTMRHFIRDQDRFMRGKVTEYKWLPQDTFVNQAIFIYDNTVAILTVDQPKIFIHRDENLANFHRSRFELLWKILEQPDDHTEAADVFPV